MKISFIIPALDEEKRIAGVVKQFDVLKGKYDFEVIVADGGSRDNTVKTAKKLGAYVVQNKRETQNIAKNRNLGAKKAKGELLVFCDADTRFFDLKVFVERIIDVFKNKNIIGGMPRVEVFPEERIFFDFLPHFFYNIGVRLSLFFKFVFSGGQCQIVKKKAFFVVGGYDEFRAHAEDSFLFKKLVKRGKLYFFHDLIVYESPRRYRKFGYLRLSYLASKSILSQLLFKKGTIQKWEKVE